MFGSLHQGSSISRTQTLFSTKSNLQWFEHVCSWHKAPISSMDQIILSANFEIHIS